MIDNYLVLNVLHYYSDHVLRHAYAKRSSILVRSGMYRIYYIRILIIM